MLASSSAKRGGRGGWSSRGGSDGYVGFEGQQHPLPSHLDGLLSGSARGGFRRGRGSVGGSRGPGGGRGGGGGSETGAPLGDKEKELEEMRERVRQMDNTLKERDQRLKEMEKTIREKDAELESAKEESAATKRSRKSMEHAVAERDGQLRGLARIFRAQSGCPQSDIERWLGFVQVTVLQKWGSDTVRLNPVQGCRTEGLLVRLYGKLVTEGMDDEAIDLVRGLVLGAEKAEEVPFQIMLFVIERWLHLIQGSQDYHAVTLGFRLRQLVSVIRRLYSQDVADVEERLEGLLSDQSTPMGALSTLLGTDNGSTLKDLIRGKQEDIGMVVLPNSPGSVWTLDFGTNFVRRVGVPRWTINDDNVWILIPLTATTTTTTTTTTTITTTAATTTATTSTSTSTSTSMPTLSGGVGGRGGRGDRGDRGRRDDRGGGGGSGWASVAASAAAVAAAFAAAAPAAAAVVVDADDADDAGDHGNAGEAGVDDDVVEPVVDSAELIGCWTRSCGLTTTTTTTSTAAGPLWMSSTRKARRGPILYNICPK
ncbi:hypothetical protein F5Y01DRAFT_322368 [Xylaria sp. FL0043]|nr:hypothetical protein F5Y01DRAFT_322368 [Xylaria sp. FL0043]